MTLKNVNRTTMGMSQKKKIALLGSTGSVGRSTLEVVSAAPDQFDVVGLACGDNVDLLRKQIDAFHPKRVSVRKQLSWKVIFHTQKSFGGTTDSVR
jgi:1-deoxy-D-xylulose 5-phosphate reductoisomerase